jgi:hypothetical protein
VPVPEHFIARVLPQATDIHDERTAEIDAAPAATSALRGHVDYADLAERVVQGVTVRMQNRQTARQETRKPDSNSRTRRVP